MKRLLLSILDQWLVAVCLLSVTAHAGKIVSYNPSYGKPVRIIQTIYSGWNIVTIVTVAQPNGCKTVTTTYYAFWIQTNQTVETVCP